MQNLSSAAVVIGALRVNISTRKHKAAVDLYMSSIGW